MASNGVDTTQPLSSGEHHGLRLLVEGTQRAFFYKHDEQGRFLYLSSCVRDVLGFEPEELIGKTFQDLILGNGERVRAQEATLQAFRDTTQRAFYTVDSPRKDGGRVTVEITKVPVYSAEGHCVMYGVARDVTREKRTADQLVLSAEILNGVDTVIVVCDGQGRITYANPATCRILHRSSGELVGKRVCDAFGITDAGTLQSRVERFARGEESVPADPEIHQAISAKGEARWLLWRGTKGPGNLVIGCAHDITAVVAAEEALRKSENRLRAIFDCSLDGMLLVNDEGRYVDANPAACAMFGMDRDELIGKCLASNCDPGAWEKLMREGSARGETCIVRADGSKAQIEYSGRANIQPGQHLFLVRDVTERKKLEAQLRQSQKMEAVGRLAGGVAHDFNNMLMVIRGYSELLQEKTKGNPLLSRYVESVLNAGDRAALITQQLLAFSRRQVIQPQLMSMNTVVEETARLLRRVIGEDIALHLFLDKNISNVNADPGQVGQIVLNLAVNARDAMPEGGQLIIETEQVRLDSAHALKDMGMPAGTFVVLKMKDSGCGMDKETQSHIFEPFFTTKPQGKGTGLGLATVYGIVKQSGGWIEVNSVKGHGTTFNVYFPACDKTAESVAAQSALPAAGGEAAASGQHT